MRDLFTYVNGPWLNTYVIPDDKAIGGTFRKLIDQSDEHLKEILADDPGKGGIIYRSFMDEEGITRAGLTPLKADLDPLTKATTIEDFVTALAERGRQGLSGILSSWVEKNSNGEDAVAYLYQGGLGLPDEAYYHAEEHAEILAQYETYLKDMLDFSATDYLEGVTPTDAAQRIVALEKEIAAGWWDVVAARDSLKTFNPLPLTNLPAIIQRYLVAWGLDKDSTPIIMMPSFIDHVAGLLTSERLSDWKLWAIVRVVTRWASFLPKEIDDRNFAFRGTVLSGQLAQQDRWKRAVGVAESCLGEEIGKAYVAKHFPASSKEEMLTLVDYLLRAYKERISQLPWMTPATREKALDKLGAFRAKIGYPDKWRSYDGLSVKEGGEHLIENLRASAEFEHNFHLSKIGKPTNRDEWLMTPQTVNACYNPTVNDITFPAAILQPPFYGPEMDTAEVFGAIGSVIGHEIGHGFDDQGSQYDGQGNLNNWWTDEDRAAFEKLTNSLIDQFDGLIPRACKDNGIRTKGVNGALTLGENIGDLGGLGIAVVAYRMWLKDHGLTFDTAPTKTIESEGGDPDMQGKEFTALQRLFLSYARVWRTKARPQLVAQLLAVDPHSPPEFRCNVIAGNIAEFYNAFDVDQDSPVWIDPDKRVTIW